MSPALPALGPADWLGLFTHFLMLSMLAVGGAMATAPDMHRYLVEQRGWLDDEAFTQAIAIGQAAPGPNLLFVAVLGWQVGGLPGAAVTMAGMLLPSTTVALLAGRWSHRHRDARVVLAFAAGMAPLTIGLLLATGVLLAQPLLGRPGALLLMLGTVLVMMVRRSSPMVLVLVGALAGALGWV